ncbi:rap guanine nucleotide exchange factor 1-like isoform X2 [Thunnus maccoyii]|uniref:rap guanine nucleotide exchange factor 1-like isoform X2 n=1 Tax=Thunnus maccoyii TaxID=8240 RepID=UPI001C4CA27C|nr:rap guanine nucleotide exchange factor 1-like isoform X2 [Thunnus maccoyii]
MSSRPESKTASQFATLTMRLKGKIHQQRNRYSDRIKQTPSPRSKPPDLDLNEDTQQDKPVCVLEDRQRLVISSLQYFKALVDKLGVDKVDKLVLDQSVVGRLLGGASGSVLEAVQPLVQLEPHLHSSKTVSACLARLHRSLAELIRWCDQVMLQGVATDNKESTASVTTVIRAVLDGVKELVRLAAERQDGSAPVSPVQSQPAVGQPGAFVGPETSDETLTCPLAEEAELQPLAPPKPVMPLLELRPPLLPPQALSPPALPPKKRHSTSGPTPCRVAIVAPMRRESEVERQECEEDILKLCSSSSADSADDDTHCGVQVCVGSPALPVVSSEEDPDYAFLHTDLSSFETLPPLPPPTTLPPTLPEKRRRSGAGASNSQASPSFGFDSTLHDLNHAQLEDVTGSLSSPLSPSKTPPPLPEKKHHIQEYMKYFSYKAPPADTDSAPSPELPPAPALPPKKRQQDADEADDQNEEQLIRDSSHSLQQEEEEQQEEEQQQQEEEVLLTSQQEILQRITMKNEEEEGPDVKAASPDILLVYATDTEGNPEQVYCEAFLCTYRTFISVNDVISKLQQRYRHLCDGGEPEHLKAAKNTFHLLVSVVDKLSVVELESDLLLLLMELVFSLLIGGELRLAHQLRSNILSKMEQKWQLIGSPQSLRPLAAKGVAARPGTLLDFRSQDLAEQLTLLDSELFRKLELPEVLLWSKEQNEEKIPNLTAFTQHFNNVSFWVRSVIILQDKPHDREKLLLKFLKIMKLLRRNPTTM